MRFGLDLNSIEQDAAGAVSKVTGAISTVQQAGGVASSVLGIGSSGPPVHNTGTTPAPDDSGTSSQLPSFAKMIGFGLIGAGALVWWKRRK